MRLLPLTEELDDCVEFVRESEEASVAATVVFLESLRDGRHANTLFCHRTVGGFEALCQRIHLPKSR
jgi:hypothetical protein